MIRRSNEVTKRTKDTYDVVVVGGGTAGISAAIAAAAAGADVLLLEREMSFGGAAVHALVPSFCGFCTSGDDWQQVVKGVGQDFLSRLPAFGLFNGPVGGFHRNSSGVMIVRQDPEITKFIFDRMMEASGADYLLGARVIGTYMEKRSILGVNATDDSGDFRIDASFFVDCTGDANLAFLAGSAMTFHSENVGSLVFRMGNVRRDADCSPEAIRTALQCAEDCGETVPFRYGRILLNRDTGEGFGLMTALEIPGLDSVVQTKTMQQGRKDVFILMDLLRRYLPGFEDARLLETGSRLGYRESRRIQGEYTLIRDDVVRSVKHMDTSIARGGWEAEMHRIGRDTEFVTEKNNNYFGIPLGALHPADTENLWCAGRIISADTLAASSIRVMGTGFATGQAAGIAAALKKTNAAHPEDVQREMIRQGGLI